MGISWTKMERPIDKYGKEVLAAMGITWHGGGCYQINGDDKFTLMTGEKTYRNFNISDLNKELQEYVK